MIVRDGESKKVMCVSEGLPVVRAAIQEVRLLAEGIGLPANRRRVGVQLLRYKPRLRIQLK